MTPHEEPEAALPAMIWTDDRVKESRRRDARFRQLLRRDGRFTEAEIVAAYPLPEGEP